MSDTTIAKPIGNAEATGVLPQAKTVSRDQLLVDIRSGRRLERIVDSIKSFLETQIAKVDQTVASCEAAVENERQLQKRLAEFEAEKHKWNKTREAEIARLSIASDELSKAWLQLESERRKFVDSKTSN